MKYCLILFLFSVFMSPGFGQDEPLRELCEGIHQIKNDQNYNPKKLLWRALKLKLFPSLYSKPLTSHIESLRPVKNPDKDFRNKRLKNLIFFVGLPIDKEQQAHAFEKEYKKTQRELKRATQKFKFLARSSSVENCLKLAHERNVQVEELKELNQTIMSEPFQAVQRLKETEAFKNQLDQLQGELSEDWTAHLVSNLGEIKEWIGSNQVANVVIVTHGKLSGHLIDSINQQYPNGFFAYLSPTLYSLSLFNCYGAQTLETYKLKAYASSNPSFYTKRIITVADAPSESESDQVAPIRGFSSFMKRLDSKISKRKRHIVKEESHFTDAQMCHLRVSAEFEKGPVALALNGFFLGLLDPSFPMLSYPCEWMKSQGNLIQLTNISPKSWDLKEAPSILGFKSQSFFNPDGSLRSVLFRDE